MSDLQKAGTTQQLITLPEQVEQMCASLDAAAEVLAGVDPNSCAGPFTAGLRTAAAMQLIEHSLSDDVMKTWVMPLLGKATGFRADKPTKKNPNYHYSIAEVRTAVIEHVGKGGWLVNDELNIIGGRAYQTKSFFFRRLDEIIPGGWRLVHDLPEFLTKGQSVTGAIAKVTVYWTAPGHRKELSQQLTFGVKADNYSTTEQIQGKVDRKAAAWLYARVTGIQTRDGEIERDEEPRRVEGRTVEPAAEERRQEFSRDDQPGVKVEPKPDPVDYVAELAKRLNDAGVTADKATAYLRSINWLADEQAFQDLDQGHAKAALDRFAGLVSQISAHGQPQENAAEASASGQATSEPPVAAEEVEKLETTGRRVSKNQITAALQSVALPEDLCTEYLVACGWLDTGHTLDSLSPKRKRWLADNPGAMLEAVNAWCDAE